MVEVEGATLQRGLGYETRVMLRDFDIKGYPEEMKEVLWSNIETVIEKAKEMKLQWTYVDVRMIILDDRVYQWNRESELS